MFNISAGEIMMITIIGLLVIGPAKLPQVARVLGALFGKMQRQVTTLKRSIKQEIELDELNKIKQEFQEAKTASGEDVSKALADLRDTGSAIDTDIRAAARVEENAEPRSVSAVKHDG